MKLPPKDCEQRKNHKQKRLKGEVLYLFARNPLGHLVTPYDQRDSSLKAYCPDCGEEMVGKRGPRKQWHWAHAAGSGDCSRTINRSPVHEWVKYLLQRKFVVRDDVEEVRVERRIDGKDGTWRFPDLLVIFKNGRKLAIEIQMSGAYYDDFDPRVAFYEENGIEQIWIPIIRKDEDIFAETQHHSLIVMAHDLQPSALKLAYSEERKAFVHYYLKDQENEIGRIKIGRTLDLDRIEFDNCEYTMFTVKVRAKDREEYDGYESPEVIVKRIIEVTFDQKFDIDVTRQDIDKIFLDKKSRLGKGSEDSFNKLMKRVEIWHFFRKFRMMLEMRTEAYYNEMEGDEKYSIAANAFYRLLITLNIAIHRPTLIDIEYLYSLAYLVGADVLKMVLVPVYVDFVVIRPARHVYITERELPEEIEVELESEMELFQ